MPWSGEVTSPSEIAREYIKRNWSPVPIPARSKIPVIHGWQNLRIKEIDVEDHFDKELGNIGVLLGKPSAGLVDLDLDALEATIIAPHYLPSTARFGRKSNQKSHYLFYCSDATTRKFSASFGVGESSMIAEVRAGGAQTVFPGSVHESGEPIDWELNCPEPCRIDASLLYRLTGVIATAALIAREWPNQKSDRHQRTLAVAGGLLNSEWEEAEVVKFISAVMTAAGDDEHRDRLACISSTAAKRKTGKQVTGWPTFKEYFGESVTNTVMKWLGIEHDLHRGSPLDVTTPGLIRLSEIEPRELEWLWTNRIPLGKVTLISGEAGFGKSLITLDLGARITNGKPFPDNTESKRGSVLLLSAEDDIADTVLPRLKVAGADLSCVAALTSKVSIDAQTGKASKQWLNLQKDLDQIETSLQTLDTPRLVIIDPITAYLGGADDHRNAAVRAVLGPLAELATAHRVAVVCVAHPPKGRGSNANNNAVSGSIAFVAAARAVYAVSDDPNSDSRLFFPVKQNLSPQSGETGLRYNVESTGDVPFIAWGDSIRVDADELLGSEENRSAIDDAKFWLRKELAKGPVKENELRDAATQCGHSWPTVKRAKKALSIQSQRIGFGSDGYSTWKVPP
jgi:putative DNA primase/helicase